LDAIGIAQEYIYSIMLKKEGMFDFKIGPGQSL
jgi:hypothetical protein